MRTFYIFYVKDFVYQVYEKYPYQLYKMLEDTYFTNKHDMMLSSSYYEQITCNFNKLFVNNYLMANHKLNGYYYRKDNIHILSNSYENSKLVISNHCLKLKSNVNYPSFFNTINGYKESIFVCDFENQDYFWLNTIANSQKNFVKE